MNKKCKKIIYIVLLLVLLIIVYVILAFKGVLPNPFLDTKDLVCFRDDTNPTVNQKIESIVIFSFDKEAIVKSYIEKRKYTHETLEENNNFYKDIVSDKTLKVEKTDKSVTLIWNFVIEKDKGYYGKTKKVLKEFYEDKFNYKCE